ncbi:hypothetical protein GCK72_017816 [Caenorhabditis remanei]|nr:hypothetical protein GCK72_017816 [Caenorhabditis remanei]KAF1751262.1 hypothetical protein GCK72_017816 [Caenorhabditis remanei]
MLASIRHQIHVKNFYISYCGNQEEVLCFLPFLRPGFLKTITLDNRKSENAYLDQVVILPQVIQAEQVCFDEFEKDRIPIESFWNIPNVRITKATYNFHEMNQLIQHYFKHDYFEYFAMARVDDDWFPKDSNTFIDDENRKSMIVKGPKFAIKIVHKLEKRAIVLNRILFTY